MCTENGRGCGSDTSLSPWLRSRVAFPGPCAPRDTRPFTVGGGGHSAAGYNRTGAGVVLDLEPMGAVSVAREAMTFTVPMGATWQDVYDTPLRQTELIPIRCGCLPVVLTACGAAAGGTRLDRHHPPP